MIGGGVLHPCLLITTRILHLVNNLSSTVTHARSAPKKKDVDEFIKVLTESMSNHGLEVFVGAFAIDTVCVVASNPTAEKRT